MTIKPLDLPIREHLGDGSTVKKEITFGRPLLDQFLLDPAYHNMNQGSFGTIPRAVQAKLREYQDRSEARPDPFIRYEYPKLLDESREAVAKLLRVPTDTVVFVNNATVGVNTVLKNLVWNEDGKDEIIYFSTIYGGCGKTIDYVVDSSKGLASSRAVNLTYPGEDDEVLSLFRAAVQASKEEGKRPAVCLFDVVSSIPGVCFPFKAMTVACRELGILSLIDGAQGVGLVDLDLGELDPDFFTSNCHKWLHVPRGCAVFYVPIRNQDLIRTSLATSHGYVSRGGTARVNPLPPSGKSRFVNEFEFVGTIDNSPYLACKDAIKWRESIGGEAKILEYQNTLAKEGGKKVAEILGTEVMDNKTGTLTNCAMVNVALPLVIAADSDVSKPVEGGSTGRAGDIRVPRVHQDRWWARLSAQVFLGIEDFEWTGNTLRELCERAASLELVNGSGA